MAESSNVFYIRAQAQGFDKVSSAARKLTDDFKAAGRAGQQMGNQVAQGLTRMHHHPHRGSHAPRPGARHPHHHRAAGFAAFPNQQGFGGGGGGGGGGGPPGQGPPAGGGGTGGGGKPPPPGTFLQGLLQATTGNMYLPQGPGMKQQAAGYTVGRLGTSIVSSAVGGGPEALVGGLSAIPGLGPILAQALGSGITAGKQEASYQSQISNMMPYIDDHFGAFGGRMNAQRERLEHVGRVYGGMSAGQTLQTMAQAVAASGGTVQDLGEDRIRHILSAQKGYGIDAGTGAIFARGEDLGATDSDSEGTAIRGAKRLNLKGSELIQYVKNIASHVQAFSQTGIKVDAKDENDASRMYQLTGGAGMTGQRAAMLGQGFEATATAISQSGPQDANQSALLMAAGWNPEDPSTYLQALRNLEDPKKRARYQAEAEDQIMQANRNLSPLQRAEVLGNYRKSTTGVQMSHREMDAALAARGTNARASQDALSTAQAEPQQLGTGEEVGQSMSNISKSMDLTVDMENRKEKVGAEEVDTVMQAEFNSQLVANTKMARMTGDLMMKAGNGMSSIGREVMTGAEMVMSTASEIFGGGLSMPKPK